MDISETYIKMRRAAIPDLFKGVPIECPCSHIKNDVWVDSKGDWYYSTEDESFQLERQDQLQEMVGIRPVDMVYHFVPPQSSESLMAHYQNYLLRSMEQLWLAFVMKEKHGKVSDGERWENA